MQETILKIFSDGGARGNPGPAAAAFVIFIDDQLVFEDKKFIGKSTNNFAEYYGVLMALTWLKDNKSKFDFTRINYFLDSELVTFQLMGKYKVKNQVLKQLYDQVKYMENAINSKIKYYAIPRENNKHADKLVNIALNEKGYKVHV